LQHKHFDCITDLSISRALCVACSKDETVTVWDLRPMLESPLVVNQKNQDRQEKPVLLCKLENDHATRAIMSPYVTGVRGLPLLIGSHIYESDFKLDTSSLTPSMSRIEDEEEESVMGEVDAINDDVLLEEETKNFEESEIDHEHENQLDNTHGQSSGSESTDMNNDQDDEDPQTHGRAQSTEESLSYEPAVSCMSLPADNYNKDMIGNFFQTKHGTENDKTTAEKPQKLHKRTGTMGMLRKVANDRKRALHVDEKHKNKALQRMKPCISLQKKNQIIRFNEK